MITNLDANRGFWKISLAKDSHMQMTFVTLFGRYYFNKLPLGISSTQRYFNMPNEPDHRGSHRVLRLMDDVLVYLEAFEKTTTNVWKRVWRSWNLLESL